MKNWIKNILLSLVLIFISIATYFIARQYPNIASQFPSRLALVLGGLSAALLVKTFFLDRKTEDGNKIDTSHFKNVLLVVGAIAIYTAMLKHAGYLVSSFLLVLFTIFLLGFTKKLPLILTSAGCVLVVYAAFKLVLGVPLPTGLFFQG